MTKNIKTLLAENKHLESELALTRNRYRTTESVAQIGSWELDLNNHKVWGSDELFRLFELDAVKEKPLDDMLQMLQDESRARLEKALKKTIATGKPYRMEMQLKLPSKHLRFIVGEGHARLDSTGKPASLYGTAQDITERKLTEFALRESEERWRTLIDNAPDIILTTDIHGRIKFINHFFDLSPREGMVGKQLYKVLAQKQADIVQSNINLMLSSAQATAFEIKYYSAQMGQLFFSCRASPLFHDKSIKELLFILSDITPIKKAQTILEQDVIKRTEELERINKALRQEISIRKKTELALITSEKRYQSLAYAAPVGIFRTDKRGNATYVNQRLVEITALEYTGLLGSNWSSMIDEVDRPTALAQWYRSVKNKEPFKMELRVHSKRWVLASAVPELGFDNDLKGFVGTLTDIHKRRAAEEELQQHRLELAHISRLTTVGELASGIAHELNQPLATIVNYVGGCLNRLEKGEKVSDDILKAMRSVAKEAERAGDIIHHLKNFLRKGELNTKNTHINDLVNDAIELQRPSLQTANIQLSYELASELPQIKADHIQIEQVIINLISNAKEALQSSNQDVKFIHIETGIQDAHITVNVQDNGPGIEEEHLKQLFEPFYTTKATGMGIGLSISRSIIEAHGGKITVQTAPKTGCRFTILLPIQSTR